MTIRERLGGFDGVRVAWLGDGNNVCASLMVMCAKLGMEFVAATPPGYEPPSGVARGRPGGRRLALGRRRPARGGRGRERPLHRRLDEHGPGGRARAPAARPRGTPHRRRRRSTPPAPDAIVLHCLPAHVGEEITERRPLRTALRRLGPGREPAAHGEGPARADRPLMGAVRGARPGGARLASAGARPWAGERRRRRRGAEPRGARPVRALRRAAVPAGADLDLPPAAGRGLRRRPGGAGARDPGHRPPRARPLLRHRRGPARRARVRVNTALEVIAIASAVVGAAVIVLFFVGPWR